jgi:hypothetical protein
MNIERYEQLEMERNETAGSIEFQSWMSELNVSRSYIDRTPIIRANELNNQYNYSSIGEPAGGGLITLVINKLNIF